MAESTVSIPAEDAERRALVRDRLNTAVLGDVLDCIGRLHQFLPQPVQPLNTNMKIVGRAMPVVITGQPNHRGKPFGLLTEALDQLRPGEVYLAASGGLKCAAWGELLTAAAKARGAVGAVIDGFHRDTSRILAQEWGVFSRGSYGLDAAPRASVTAFRVPVRIDSVKVSPGDLIMGDADGVIVIPQEVEEEVFERALSKVRDEDLVRAAIEDGRSTTRVFTDFGVL